MSGGTVRDWAAWYIERGWVTIPVVYQDKIAIPRNWPQRTLSEAETLLPTEFRADQARNIGINLGVNSGNLADVDLDSPEALALAYLFLPKTLVFGRKSTPQSHWLYTCPIDKDTFEDPIRRKTNEEKQKKKAKKASSADTDDNTHTKNPEDKSMLLEIRSTGCQTVFPPSIHKDTGEQIAFADPAVVPTSITPKDLLWAVERLAAVCLLARYLPATGRHKTQLAITGALLQDGWSEELTLDVLCAVKSTDRRCR